MKGVLGRLRPRSTETVIVVAIGDYKPENPQSSDAFKKGDKFTLKSGESSNWWQVKRVDNGDVFFAPSNYVVKESELHNFEWLSFDVDRDKAEGTLKKAKFGHGAFIIRATDANNKSSTNFNSSTLSLKLSVKVRKPTTPETFSVVHFVVDREGTAYRIGTRSFESLTHLVRHYADRRNESNISLMFSVKKDEMVTLWEYDPKVIDKLDRLDRGHFGEVFLGKLYGKEVVAIKSPDLSRMDRVEFLKEALISRPCKHQNVLETIGICTERLFIIAEYMKNGSLKKYLGRNQLSPEECLSVVQKIACGMDYLTSTMKIVHRDLAARNVLVGETIDSIKVADFGLARSLEDSKYYITRKETFPLRWTAPEAFVMFEGILNTQLGKITSAADVWSFAVVMWEEPYLHISGNERELYTELTENNYRLARPERCPEEIYAKMRECWELERKDRPTFALLHSFLSSQIVEQPAAVAPSSSSTSTTRLAHSDTEDETAEDEQRYNAANDTTPDDVAEEAARLVDVKLSEGESGERNDGSASTESTAARRSWEEGTTAATRVPITLIMPDNLDNSPDRPTTFSLD